MSQVSSRLRRAVGAYAHWCPGCEEMHPLPDAGWTFDGNLEAPTFTPSFKHTGLETEKVEGRWTGNWVRDAAGNPRPVCCHYTLTAGQLHFHEDCTHALRSSVVPLPLLPAFLRDDE